MTWKIVGRWLHGPNGERLRALAGSEGMGGAGGGGGMGGAGMQQGLGMGSGMDWTFGQGKVWDDKVKRKMALMMQLIGSNHGSQVVPGQSPGPTKVDGWDPTTIMKLLSFVGGSR